MAEADRAELEQRILVLAPTGRDAANCQSVLAKAGLTSAVCRNVDELSQEIGAGVGAALLTEESLSTKNANRLVEVLGSQPPWSDLPVLLLSRGGPESPAALRAMQSLGNVIHLERPVRVSTLVTAARTALRARGRQYEIRGHLRELRAADRRKDEFLALLAHELRNPLVPLRNGLQVMRLSPGDAQAQAQARAMMDRQLSHMVRLIDDLLDVSRLSQNKLHLQKERVVLAEVVSHAVEAARPTIEAAGHKLTVSLPQEPVYLEADLTRLAQVFSNLLSNSAKYTERGGHVWLTAEYRGELVVTVKDTGVGIPPEAIQNIFDMFSQVDRSIERTTGGLGIGLALVKGLVEMHGGRIEAASDGVGRGSKFTVYLPAEMEKSAAPLQPAGEDGVGHSGPGRRILVVDDNRDSAESMAMMLRLLGNEVRTAHDGVEAVEAAGDYLPEVVLMDIGMPRLNGLDATRRIREQPWGREMTVIALSGWGLDGDRLRSGEAGCNGHLVKPVSLADLQKVLGLANAPVGKGTV